MGRVRSRLLVGAASLLVATLALTGCTPEPERPTPRPTASASPSAEPETEAPPVLDPDGTATDNLAYFDLVNQTLLAQNPAPGGQGHIDALVAAGFDKAAMQVTPDTTTARVNADNVLFSVLFAGECLVGQSGHAGYHGAVVPVLGTGKCLVGTTRPIDW